MIFKQLAIFFLVFLNTVYAFPKKGARGGGGGGGKGGGGKGGGGSGATGGSSRAPLNGTTTSTALLNGTATSTAPLNGTATSPALLNGTAASTALLNGTATAGGSSGGIDPLSDALIQCYLAYHNNARKEVGVPPLTWDPKLAESATAYSITLYNRSPDDIDLEHSDLDVGENLYASYKKSKNGKYSGNASCEKGMQGWLDEKPLYTPGTGYSNGNGYGHYTQMVNRAVTKVGCGADTKTGMYLTCHYDKIQRSGKPAF